MINGLDLFSGIGGITLGLSEWVRPIAYCENEPYAQSVLKSRMQDGSLPAAPIWDDVRTLDGRPFEGLVDIIYGGFPCQDISVAGKQEGLEGERSALFFEIMRLAKEIKPSFIFLENVSAIRTKGLGTVCEELASLRCDCRWGMLSAYDVGAPHQRDRWFLLAHSNSLRQLQQKRIKQKQRRWVGNICKKTLADTMCERLERWEKPKSAWKAFAEYGCEGFTRGISGIPQPAICRDDDGIRNRAHRIKCLGNAVVPEQVREAFVRLAGIRRED